MNPKAEITRRLLGSSVIGAAQGHAIPHSIPGGGGYPIDEEVNLSRYAVVRPKRESANDPTHQGQIE